MGIHDDHRKRVRDAFIQNGAEGSADHQLLEHLLFYSIPRIDTNPIAHKLIARFGSIRDVLDADYEDLLEVDGIGEHSAALIKLSAAISKAYLCSDHAKITCYDTVDKVGRFLASLFAGQTKETVFLLLFNSRLEIIKVVKLGVGHVGSVVTSARAIIENALNNKQATGIVLAHNHPSGIAMPSGDDIDLTSQLEFFCNQLGVKLMEHIVVSGNDYYPIMRHKKQLR